MKILYYNNFNANNNIKFITNLYCKVKIYKKNVKINNLCRNLSSFIFNKFGILRP